MPYHRFTDDECWLFLRDPVRTAGLATTRADGRPHQAPIWYDIDGPDMVFNTGVDTVKGRNVTANPRVSLCVQDDQPPYTYVVVEGGVELSTELSEVREWAGRIGGRYMGPDQAEAYGERNGVPGEYLVRVKVQRLSGATGLADWGLADWAARCRWPRLDCWHVDSPDQRNRGHHRERRRAGPAVRGPGRGGGQR